MMSTPIEEHPLLVSFVNGDDAYRNSRFKLIPYISKVGVKDYYLFLDLFIIFCPSYSYPTWVLRMYQGSWIVKQSVGKKACLVGQALEINYFRGNNYIEVTVRS